MEKAFGLDQTDARIFMELDQLRKKLGQPAGERLAQMEAHEELVAQRDDLIVEKITLLNQTGEYEKAMSLIGSHKFHPWEGGEGKVGRSTSSAAWSSPRRRSRGKSGRRLETLLEECLSFPQNLGEGKLAGAQDNDFWYFLGIAHEGLGEHEKAVECWQKATEGPREPAAALYYNDAKPDKIFYQGAALRALGREGEARGRFYSLVTYGVKHYFDKIKMDYFAVSLPDLQIWDSDLSVSEPDPVSTCSRSDTQALATARWQRSISLSWKALAPGHQGVQAL